MNVISMAKCDGCGRLIRCAVCGKPVEAVPVLENEIFMPDGVPLCVKCTAQPEIQTNEPHPLTRKHGSTVLQAWPEFLNS
jgi:hypothetical protein